MSDALTSQNWWTLASIEHCYSIHRLGQKQDNASTTACHACNMSTVSLDLDQI